MKKIVYNMTVLVLCMSWLASCSEHEFATYQGEKTGIYMAEITSRNSDGTVATFLDSIAFSFASYKDEEIRTTKNIPVWLMGNVTSDDRPFVLKVDEAKSTAIRGTHFDFLDSDCFIPANKATKSVPIIIYRHPDLATKTLRIEFYLESNEIFTTELENYKSTVAIESSGIQLCGSRFKLSFSEFYAVTAAWNKSNVLNALGTWSTSKEKRVNAIMGWTHADWEGDKIPYGRIPFSAKSMRKELQELADKGTPVIDDDGKYMQLAGIYIVDYSAYNK